LSLLSTPAISTLSLHDALPISQLHQTDRRRDHAGEHGQVEDADQVTPSQGAPGEDPEDDHVLHGPEDGAPDGDTGGRPGDEEHQDRKSTRLNSSHRTISYAVFC